MRKILLFVWVGVSVPVLQSQMIVSDPNVFSTLQLMNTKSSTRHVKTIQNMVEQLQKMGDMLNTARDHLHIADSSYTVWRNALKKDYDFVIGLKEAQWSDMWEVGEYLTGASLNPVEYMPAPMSDPIITKYMDKHVGWSSQNVRDWNRQTGYNNPTSSSIKHLYPRLFPTMKEIKDVRAFKSDFKTPSMSREDKELLAYYEFMLNEGNSDSLQAVSILNEMDRVRTNASLKIREIKELEKEVEKREKAGLLTKEDYALMTAQINHAHTDLERYLAQLKILSEKLSLLLKKHAQKTEAKINQEIADSVDKRIFRSYDKSRKVFMKANVHYPTGQLFGE